MEKIKEINFPILVMHGEKDTIVPFSMGVEIYENANSPKSKYFIKYDDHMMNFDQNLVKAIEKFINNLK
ncbi:alpha/beta hydrolase [Pelagibacterales bacterium SAG-MED14]|nr:alpha/beta hydrolase [Pelagibacterales bacterium SAG-MED14]